MADNPHRWNDDDKIAFASESSKGVPNTSGQTSWSPPARRSRAVADGTIGKTIAIKRYKLKIGLRELARELQISPSYLVGIEHDERLPAARLAERIEKRLGIPRLVDRIRDAVIARWEAGSRG